MPVRKVERLRSKFQLRTLVNLDLLKQRHVEVLKTGTTYLLRATA